jgi:hypothetical protein
MLPFVYGLMAPQLVRSSLSSSARSRRMSWILRHELSRPLCRGWYERCLYLYPPHRKAAAAASISVMNPCPSSAILWSSCTVHILCSQKVERQE